MLDLIKNILTQKEGKKSYWLKNLRNNFEEYNINFGIILRK